MRPINESLRISEYTLDKVIFQLDEDSNVVLDCGNSFIVEMGKYNDKLKNKKRSGNRVIWTSNDGDNLRIGTHATEREDRPIGKGGDGEHIDEQEIIDMFVYAWKDIMEMYVDGDIIEKESDVISSRCYLKHEGNKIVPNGARPMNKNLWAAFHIKEKEGYKVDVVIRTIFRGQTFYHSKSQERIVITINGKIIKIYNDQ